MQLQSSYFWLLLCTTIDDFEEYGREKAERRGITGLLPEMSAWDMRRNKVSPLFVLVRGRTREIVRLDSCLTLRMHSKHTRTRPTGSRTLDTFAERNTEIAEKTIEYVPQRMCLDRIAISHRMHAACSQSSFV
jgi:hypothetical protein